MAKKARRTRPHPKVSLRRVMSVMRAIHKKGKSAHFMAAARKAGVKVAVPPKTVRFIQKFVNDNNLAAHAELKTIGGCPKPYQCPDIAT